MEARETLTAREGFPGTLKAAIDHQLRGEPVPIEGDRILSAQQYAYLREGTLAAIERESVENPYHNRSHTEGVESRFLRLAREAGLSLGETETGGIASLLHDYGHPGRTIRQEVLRDIPHKDMSNEEYAAMRAHELLVGMLPSERIIAVQSAILGTSFGQAEGPYARPYKPLSRVDKLVAFADVAGFTNGFDAWMQESMRVYREMPFGNLPPDFEALVRGRAGFLAHLDSKLSEIGSLIGEESTRVYREMLDAIRQGLASEAVGAYRMEFDAIRARAQEAECKVA